MRLSRLLFQGVQLVNVLQGTLLSALHRLEVVWLRASLSSSIWHVDEGW